MSQPIIEVQNLSKLYKLGEARTFSIKESWERWWDKKRGKNQNLIYGRSKSSSSMSFPDEQKGPEPNTFWALKDVSFSVQQGEVVGIIGRNGAGKSTLLKILSKITEPTSGRAIMRGRVASLLEVGTGFHPDLTGRENVYMNGAILGMRHREIARKFDEIIAFAEVEKFIDTPVKHYSSGMYVRLAFAVAAHLDPEILLVDEVLAVGDTAFQNKCLGKMDEVAKRGRTIFFVSHNLGMIRQLCEKGILLHQGRMKKIGNTTDIIAEYIDSFLLSNRSVFLKDRKDRSGNGRVRAVDCSVLGSGGNSGILSTGEKTKFVLRYKSTQRIKRLYVGLGIKNAFEAGIFFCSTSMQNSDFIDAPSEGIAELIIDNLPLIPSKYWVDVKINDAEGLADYVVNAFQFEVVEGSLQAAHFAKEERGNVFVPHRWELHGTT